MGSSKGNRRALGLLLLSGLAACQTGTIRQPTAQPVLQPPAPLSEPAPAVDPATDPVVVHEEARAAAAIALPAPAPQRAAGPGTDDAGWCCDDELVPVDGDCRLDAGIAPVEQTATPAAAPVPAVPLPPRRPTPAGTPRDALLLLVTAAAAIGPLLACGWRRG